MIVAAARVPVSRVHCLQGEIRVKATEAQAKLRPPGCFGPASSIELGGTSIARIKDTWGSETVEGKVLVKNLVLTELEELCLSLGERPQRARQLWRSMYADFGLLEQLSAGAEQPNNFSTSFLEKARKAISLSGGLELVKVVPAKDGTRKLLFKVLDGPSAGGEVESVLIPSTTRQGLRERLTLCVSSQVGCAMNCQFCCTGRMGLLSNLCTANIVEQVVAARRLLKQTSEAHKLTNVVFMGMGEPLHNFDAVVKACNILSSPLGLQVSHNKVTVSTVGLVPELRRFVAACPEVQVAVSLHATSDEVRDQIVPINRRYPLSELTSALRELFPLSRRRERQVLIQYTLLKGVNDSPRDAAAVVSLLRGMAAKVNLLTFNPHEGTRFEAAPLETLMAFRAEVQAGGLVCTVRDSRGGEEMAACGQLGKPPPRRSGVQEVRAAGPPISSTQATA